MAAYSIILDFDGIDAVKGYFGENYENVIHRVLNRQESSGMMTISIDFIYSCYQINRLERE